MRDKAVNTWGASRFIQQPYEFFFWFFFWRDTGLVKAKMAPVRSRVLIPIHQTKDGNKIQVQEKPQKHRAASLSTLN
jgi:hypothetical protein